MEKKNCENYEGCHDVSLITFYASSLLRHEQMNKYHIISY